MIHRVMGSIFILLIASHALAQEITPVGSFENVRSSDGGEHCYGYSLELWRYRDQLLGLLNMHEGLCGDPPCGVLHDVRHDEKSGRLVFRTRIGERRDFVGTLKLDSVVGTLDGRSIHLARNKDWAGSGIDPEQTLAGWCEFWSAIPRCKGVRELCETLKRR